MGSAGARLWFAEKGVCEAGEASWRTTYNGQHHILAVSAATYHESSPGVVYPHASRTRAREGV